MEKTITPMSLTDYLRMFNFISKVAYYRTNARHFNTNARHLNNSLGALRKECCSDLIEYDVNLNKIASILKSRIGLKYLDMYTEKINDNLAISIVIIDSKPVQEEIIKPVIYSNDIIFADDLKHVYALIDYRLFNTEVSVSCADYFEQILNCMVTTITNEDLSGEEFINPVKTKKKSMRLINILFSNLLYKDSMKYLEDYGVISTVNMTIDKLMGQALDKNTEYMSVSIDRKEEIRAILTDFIALQDEDDD